jgi:hypothetical protein
MMLVNIPDPVFGANDLDGPSSLLCMPKLLTHGMRISRRIVDEL